MTIQSPLPRINDVESQSIMTYEMLLPAAFVAGFLGSAHCISMCGAIVILFEQQAGRNAGWRNRLFYNTGRLSFYVLLGAIAGAGGAAVKGVVGINSGLLVLRIIAGLLVLSIGLNLLFNWAATRFLERGGAALWRKLSPLAKHVLPISTAPKAFAAGLLWGALPCGLVYSAMALAGTSGELLGGSLTMATFWAGTAPAMLFAGQSASWLAVWKAKRVVRVIAGVLMLLMGVTALLPAKMLLTAM